MKEKTEGGREDKLDRYLDALESGGLAGYEADLLAESGRTDDTKYAYLAGYYQGLLNEAVSRKRASERGE